MLGTVLVDRTAALSPPDSAEEVFRPNVWLSIDDDGTVTVRTHKVELGQGVVTALAMLVAEELDAAWSQMRFEHGTRQPEYFSELVPFTQFTFGSTSVRDSWRPLREAGAAARAMLVAAAAAQWSVPTAEITVRQGVVRHRRSRRHTGFGQLAASAARQPLPAEVTVKEAAQWRLIGRSVPRLDTAPKITGTATFGIDLQLPGLLTAVPLRPPSYGRRVASFDPSRALRVPGVREIVQVEGRRVSPTAQDVLLVLAESYWPALRGSQVLAEDTRWTPGPADGLTDDAIRQRLRDQLSGTGTATETVGDVDRAFEAARHHVDEVYEVPYLAHVAMEPVTCAAPVTRVGVDVWVGHQNDTAIYAVVAGLTGRSPTDPAIRLHQLPSGGGFGRRLDTDFVSDAVLASQQVGGRPVKVIWPREQDIAHDRFRPASAVRVKLALDGAGAVSAIEGHVATQRLSPGPPAAVDRIVMPGLANDGGYDIPNRSLRQTLVELPVPVGFWRGVAHTHNTFALECALDELARRGEIDPLALRRRLVRTDPRGTAVLEAVADQSSWFEPSLAGIARGLAYVDFGGTRLAAVAEVRRRSVETYTVERLTLVADCGVVVNPRDAAEQLHGAAIFGLSATLDGEITIRDGIAVERNLDTAPFLRIDEIPRIVVKLLASTEPPTGLGEPGVVVVAPAVANALAALTGRPHRRLPLRSVRSGRR
ncbi:MAG: molybdopterin cofactor-binding domain-containing protein [Dermatophilaceae bacterium]